MVGYSHAFSQVFCLLWGFVFVFFLSCGECHLYLGTLCLYYYNVTIKLKVCVQSWLHALLKVLGTLCLYYYNVRIQPEVHVQSWLQLTSCPLEGLGHSLAVHDWSWERSCYVLSLVLIFVFVWLTACSKQYKTLSLTSERSLIYKILNI